MIRKAIIFTFIFLIISSYASAMTAYIDWPQTNPGYGDFGAGVYFEGYVDEGTPDYTFAWTFCTGCVPENSNLEDPGLVEFPLPGEYTVNYDATDSTMNSISDVITIINRLGAIDYPNNNSYWGANESIPFDGIGYKGDPLATYTYDWDFGDIAVNTIYAAKRNMEDPTNVEYTLNGSYEVSLTVTDLTSGINETKNITLKIVLPIGTNFTCTTDADICATDEIELVRLFRLHNSHLRGPDDPDKEFYDYPICCKTKTILTSETSDLNSPAIFLSMESDTEAETGGSSIEEKIIKSGIKHYELISPYGAAPTCETKFLGLNDKCKNYKQECIYEFYPEEGGEPSHVSNCTNETEENSYKENTWAMCCVIAEDCTNNLDDNLNIWFDCNDDICNQPGYEKPCGTSDRLLHNPSCSWMNDLCNETGCNFTDYSHPYWDDTHNTYGFELPDASYPNCKIYFNQVSSLWVTEGCGPGTTQSDIVVPQEAIDAIPGINSNPETLPLTTTAEEAYFRCRFFFCSAGENEGQRPLPVFVDDMIEDGNDTRHCCRIGTYWDPASGSCIEFNECYNKDDFTDSKPCQADFLTEKATWLTHNYGNFGVLNPPEDCVRDDLIATDIMIDTICCPVWAFNENTYSMTDIEYFMHP